MSETTRLPITQRFIGTAVALIALIATACGSGDETGTAAPGTATPTTSALRTSSAPAGSPSATNAPLTTTAPSATSSVNRCASVAAWGSGARQLSVQSRGELHAVRIGRHDCFDRLVFDVDDPTAVGYAVRYVPLVHADASDKPLPVPGHAVLQAVVLAPEAGSIDGGHPLAATGDYLYSHRQLAGWTTLRAVRFAGSFEGQCTFAVGVRDRLPFRVFTTLDNADQVRRVVVDIGH